MVHHFQFSPDGKFLVTSGSRLVLLCSDREMNAWRTDDSELHSWDQSHMSIIFQAGVSTCLSSWLVCD